MDKILCVYELGLTLIHIGLMCIDGIYQELYLLYPCDYTSTGSFGVDLMFLRSIPFAKLVILHVGPFTIKKA